MAEELPLFEANGLVFFTDPHNLSDGKPRGRIDDTAESIFNKQEWIVEYANKNKLVPACGGDLLHQRGRNSNRTIGRLFRIFGASWVPVPIIPGNHDMQGDKLSEHDALSILGESWNFLMARHEPQALCRIKLPSGRIIGIGGTPFGAKVPDDVGPYFREHVDAVFWMIHFSAGIPSRPGDGELRIVPDHAKEIKGCRFVGCGDIHKSFGDQLSEAERERGLPVKDHSGIKDNILTCGQTNWINIGSIGRMSSDQHIHTPSVLVIAEKDGKPELKIVPVEAAKPSHQVFSLRENETTKVNLGEQGALPLENKENKSLLAEAATDIRHEIDNEGAVDYIKAINEISTDLKLDEDAKKTLIGLLNEAELKDGIVAS